MSDIKTEWDLGPLFAGDDDPRMAEGREALRKLSYEFIDKWKPREDYLKSANVLREALDEFERWARLWGGSGGDEGYYFWLRTTVDENNAELKAKFNKIEEFAQKIQNDIQFFTLKLAKVPPEKQKVFLAAKELEPYRHFLERLFAESRYLLSEAEEKIMNLKSMPAHENWVRMTSAFLSKEERETILEDGTKAKKTFADLLTLMESPVKKARDSAAAAFNQILAAHLDVAENELNSILLDKKINDELRHMERPDLARHVADDVDPNTVDALLAAVESRFDISRRFYEMKAKLLGVPKLAYHERNVPYGRIDVKYSFEQAYALAKGVFEKLDPQFALILERFAANGQIDVYPRKGKQSGAFCAHYSIPQPTYILLNHGGTLRDVTTLAHEMGHGINNELMRERQNALSFGTPTSTAEVASVFMEDFIFEEVLREADEETRLSMLMTRLQDEISTAFRQVACYLFEAELHRRFREKGYLSKEEIGSIFQKHMAAYMGDHVEQSSGSENWWVYWSHIRNFFYVYSYAGGQLISKSMQNSVRKDPAFILKVKDFLAAGLSRSPREIFLEMEIDIADPEFWKAGIEEIARLLTETEELAKKLGKI